MCFPLHSGLRYTACSTFISRDWKQKKRQKYDEFIFESYCMGVILLVLALKENTEWIMHYNAWLHIHLGIITYFLKNINQTINFEVFL